MPKPVKLEWFPWYPEVWLTDDRVLALSPPERDAYLTMLCLQWRYGSLPFDCIHLYPLLFENTDKRAAVKVLLEFFPPDPDTNRRRNPKLTAIRERQERLHAATIAGARKTNKIKKMHAERTAQRHAERPQIVEDSFPLRGKGVQTPHLPIPPRELPPRSLDAAGRDAAGNPEPIQPIVWRVIADLPPNRESRRDS